MGVTQSPQGASGSNDRMPLTISEHIDEFNRRWFQWLRDLLPKLKSRRNKMANDDSPGDKPSVKPPAPQKQPAKPQSQQPRYEVRDQAGQQVAESDSLKQAHQDWKDQTNSEGRIIDRETGQDVTPEKDDNGRYVVLDKDGKPVGSYDDLDMAKDAWRTLTNTEGTIIDMKTKTDVTPEKQYSTKLDHQQLATALQMARGASKLFGDNDLKVDPDVVAKYIKQLNRMKIPAYDIVNLRGRGRTTPTKTVPIVRREVTIETVRRQVEVEKKGTPAKSRWLFVSHPTDDFEPTPVRGFRDIGKVRARDYARPDFEEKLMAKRLMRRGFQEEIPGEIPVQKVKEWQNIEEPKVREWTEHIEVADDQQAQLLELVVDVSGSMAGSKINMAIALAIVIMSAHLDDDSQYLYRQFASIVGSLHIAKTPSERRALCKDLFNQDNNLGGSTEIIPAISAAADDVRARAKTRQAMEILLITDGDDWAVNSETVYDAIGTDVTLHSVMVDGSNPSLQRYSTTYYELNSTDNLVLSGSTVLGGSMGQLLDDYDR